MGLFEAVVNTYIDTLFGLAPIQLAVYFLFFSAGVFVGIMALSCLCLPLHKPSEILSNLFCIYWSICLLFVPNRGYSEDQIKVIIGITAAMIVFCVVHHLCPFFYREETESTTYYLILGTLFGETKTEGGMVPVAGIGLGVTLVGTFILYLILKASMNFKAMGIGGIIGFAVMLILNTITFVLWAKEEF